MVSDMGDQNKDVFVRLPSRCRRHRNCVLRKDRIERGLAWFTQSTPNRFDDVDIMFHGLLVSLVGRTDAKPIWQSCKPFYIVNAFHASP